MIRKNRKSLLLFPLLVCLPLFVTAQSADPSLLTLERIFTKGEFGAKGLGGFKWLAGGDAYAKLEPSATVKGGTDLVSYDLATSKRTILMPAEKLIPTGATAPLPIQGYEWSADKQRFLIYTNSKKVWRLNTRGDYWILDIASGKLTKLGGNADPSTLMFAKFSPDGKKVGYVRNSDLYVEDVTNGKVTRLTTNGSPTMINGTSDWVNEEEFRLRDCWRWSPDSQSIAYWQFDASGIKDFLLINNTDEIYPKLTKIPYPKVGTTNAAVRVGVISADGGDTTWMKTPGDPRNNYIVMMDWAGPDELVLQHMNRLQNNTQLIYANAKTGEARAFLTEKDDAWIDVHLTEMSWLDGGKRFVWVSERDGWRRVYSVARDGSDIKLITTGTFDAMSIQSVDKKGGWLYYIASPDNATQRYLYRSRIDGTGSPERVTPDAHRGWNAYNISPNNRWAVRTYASFGRAPSIELVDLSNKSVVRSMEDNAGLQAKLNALERGPQEFFRVDIGEAWLDGWMIKPPGFDPSKKYPVLFYVYGEPAGTTVNDNWGSNNYLWYTMLAQQGSIVASVDNRGTPAPKGRAWRKSAYRKVGVISSQDQAATVKGITAKMPFVDASRIAIWGWSGGGSSTLNAMFRYPDLYKVGMSVAPVANQLYYDTIYQERYMGLPQDNAEDFKQGSPITFANGLKGNLLIVHGTGDDNVHYQATELLINELIRLNKHFDMMAYPNRSHSINEGENTSRHLYELLTRYLKEHLPADPVVKQ